MGEGGVLGRVSTCSRAAQGGPDRLRFSLRCVTDSAEKSCKSVCLSQWCREKLFECLSVMMVQSEAVRVFVMMV